MAGVEPARPCGQRILSPSRLPIPTHRRWYRSVSYTHLDVYKRQVKGIPNSAKVVEYGAILTTDDAVGSDTSKFVVDGNGVKKGVSGSNSSSGQSMGQYVISASTKQALNGASKAYMRSYVTYSYVVTSRTVNEVGIAVDTNSTVYKTVYSDIESKIIK